MAAGREIIDSNDMKEIAKIIKDAQARDKNEADTRHQIIDFVIHNLLKWPRNRVLTEQFVREGYIDYSLKKKDESDILIIEAKKEGLYFELPHAISDEKLYSYVTLSKLLTDQNIKSAVDQVRSYCFDTGCEIACITNGHEWILFRATAKGKKWQHLKAFVIRKLDFFIHEYTRAYNSLSFIAVTEKAALSELLSSSEKQDRGIFYPKEKISTYSHIIQANRLAGTLRPIIGYYFGTIIDDDKEFMDRCYVAQRDYKQASDGMRVLLQDSLSPYFQHYGVQQLDDTGRGGQVGGRITKNIKHGRKGEVLVLFGGKGSGKSTFIKKLLYHNPPPWLKSHSIISIVDLLNQPPDKRVIRKHIWHSLVQDIDVDGILSGDRDAILNLFADKFETAKKQELFGLDEFSEIYNIKLNDLVAKWKSDSLYTSQRLLSYWQSKNKGVVIVVDNTDQYSSDLQDFCFSAAQEIASNLKCITIISMREERFFNSKIHGLLDAFQNSGFHISSPRPSDVFKKRLEYVIMLLSSDRRRRQKFHDIDGEIARNCVTYLRILLREFENDRSPLNTFLTACAHGDIRLSLDLFRSFIVSGYTNVDEMLVNERWFFQLHQVIKPVMIPSRYYYDESLSNIPNIYQIRHNRNGSHFTSLRILRKLSKAMDASNYAYVPTSELISYFIETFGMHDDFTSNIDILLKHGFVESSNRLDYYSDHVDSVKITNYGLYMLNNLCSHFTYLDLICTDSGVYEEETNNFLVEAARKEFNLFNIKNKIKRIEVRLDRVSCFITYLEKEEMREREEFSLGMQLNSMFTAQVRASFDAERERVILSAKRQQA